MKKFLFTVSAIALALAAGSAFAADLPSRKEAPVYVPPPPPPPMWTGFYVGLNIGGGWSANNNSNNNVYLPYSDPRYGFGTTPGLGLGPNLFLLPGGSTNGNSNNGGVVGGGQVGYNYQFGNSFLIGVEADFQGTSIGSGGNQGNSASFYPSPFPPGGGYLAPLTGGNGGNIALQWFGTVRGRVGFLVTPTLLIYGTGGFAYGHEEALNVSNTRTGWTAGGGVEWLFAPQWSVKAEYLYVQQGSGGVQGPLGFTFATAQNPSINVVRAGVNYHFNWGAPAPVVAKY